MLRCTIFPDESIVSSAKKTWGMECIGDYTRWTATIVFLNGEKVTDFKEGDPVPAKTRDFEPERGPRPLTGYIGIQNHDDLSTAYFKEIAIKPLKK